MRRPSIIIHKGESAAKLKSSGSSGSSSGGGAISQTGGAPPPAHSQKPVTLPANIGSGYSKLDASIPAAGGRQQLPQVPPIKMPQVPPAAMLELALCPPIPAVVTPSIFVPSRRIYVDPSIDVKKSRSNSASGNFIFEFFLSGKFKKKKKKKKN